MTSLQILGFLKVANLVLFYGVGLTWILLMIRHVSRADNPEDQPKSWVQALQAVMHCTIWFALIRLLDIV